MIKYFLFLCAFSVGTLFAKEIELKGKVRDINTYSVIPNANIYIAGHNEGTASKSDGTFVLTIDDPQENLIVVIEHVAFDTLRVGLLDALDTDDFYLQPRIIEVPLITVEAQRDMPDIHKDIPQSLALVEARRFEVQGYTDAGDLLKTEHSVQIDEDINGEKNISIRAGNSDDVIILYNGIKMNDTYDNRFDLSLINLEDIKQVQIIKGSNTALYGSDAFSGVVNFVPKAHRNFLIRFLQRFGTYNSGDFNLQLNHYFFNRLNVSYNYKKGANQRRYGDDPDGEFHIKNSLEYHTANVIYDFSEDPEFSNKNRLSGSFLYSQTQFADKRYDEKLDNLNRVVSLRYEGDIAMISDLNLIASQQILDQSNRFSSGSDQNFSERNFNNRKQYFNLEKNVALNAVSVLLALQYENAEVDYSEINQAQILGIESGLFKSGRTGFVSILKIHTPTGSPLMQTADFDISYRYDQVKNQTNNITYRNPIQSGDPLIDNNWGAGTIKFSAHLSGNHTIAKYTTFINYGTNIKFPTLFQQLSTPAVSDPQPGVTTNLNPEKNRSLDLGFEMIRDVGDIGAVSGWSFALTYFTNYYENKFRTYRIPGVPISFYENVATADIFGFETKIRGYFFKKKLTMEFAASDYSISDKAAFPFKSDTKLVANMFIDHAGYSFQLHWFKENEQIGLIRDRTSIIPEEYYKFLTLPAYQNVDIHLGKTFEIYKFRLLTNFSVRNLFDKSTELEGITIRDRRFYVSVGVEY